MSVELKITLIIILGGVALFYGFEILCRRIEAWEKKNGIPQYRPVKDFRPLKHTPKPNHTPSPIYPPEGGK